METYRYSELKDALTSSNLRARTRQPSRLRRLFIFLIVLVICVTYFLGLFARRTPWIKGVKSGTGKGITHYVVIIDAGTSASRVLAYKFRVPFSRFGHAFLNLEEEYFEESKPGLSSFLDVPRRGAKTIVRLIKKADFFIPQVKKNSTPLVVRATSALRLLEPDKVQRVLEEISLAISKLGYDVGTDGVEIMEESDEGIFVWYTVNVLHNLLTSFTMAVLNLGGSTLQITYDVDDDDSYPSADCYVVPAGRNITLYTHSYYRLGLQTARLGVLQLEAGDSDSTHFKSVCVAPVVMYEQWVYANTKYSISGAERPEGASQEPAYNSCAELVRRYVLNTLDWEPQRTPRGRLAAMSFFYDVAADAGIIDVDEGGFATPGQFRKAALRSCVSADEEKPWACLDLTYVTTLLMDTFKLRERHRISLLKKVNGHKVSWAFELAYTTVMKKVTATTRSVGASYFNV